MEWGPLVATQGPYDSRLECMVARQRVEDDQQDHDPEDVGADGIVVVDGVEQRDDGRRVFQVGRCEEHGEVDHDPNNRGQADCDKQGGWEILARLWDFLRQVSRGVETCEPPVHATHPDQKGNTVRPSGEVEVFVRSEDGCGTLFRSVWGKQTDKDRARGDHGEQQKPLLQLWKKSLPDCDEGSQYLICLHEEEPHPPVVDKVGMSQIDQLKRDGRQRLGDGRGGADDRRPGQDGRHVGKKAAVPFGRQLRNPEVLATGVRIGGYQFTQRDGHAEGHRSNQQRRIEEEWPCPEGRIANHKDHADSCVRDVPAQREGRPESERLQRSRDHMSNIGGMSLMEIDVFFGVIVVTASGDIVLGVWGSCVGHPCADVDEIGGLV